MRHKNRLMAGIGIMLLLGAVLWALQDATAPDGGPVTAKGRHAPGSMMSGPVMVQDGDSLELDGQRIRLWAIDAPEYKQYCQQGQVRRFCGEEAQAALQALIADEIAECHQKNTDSYGRIVAQCFVGGRDLGAEMVRAGWALAYIQYGGEIYADAEAEARAAQRGLWAMSFTKPWVWRQRQRAAKTP